MIVSRAAELSRLDDLLTALAGGAGGALIVRGEAGIGKTTLLEALAARSGDAVTVIRACGAETEAELTFSALADLLDPVLGELTALPEPQAAALMGALALGPPAPGDRLAVCVAALGVLRRSAARCSPSWTTCSGSMRLPASASSTPPAGPAGGSRSCWRRGTRGTRPSTSTCRSCRSGRSTTPEPPNCCGTGHRTWRRPSPPRSRRPPRAIRWP
jgi:hypothetical protein